MRSSHHCSYCVAATLRMVDFEGLEYQWIFKDRSKRTTGIQINSLYRGARGRAHIQVQVQSVYRDVYRAACVLIYQTNECPIGRVSRSGKHRKPNSRDSRQRYRGFGIIGVNAILPQSRAYKSRACRPIERMETRIPSPRSLFLLSLSLSLLIVSFFFFIDSRSFAYHTCLVFHCF